MDENRAPEQDDQDRREAEERAEKMERGEETLTDIFTVVPAIMAERRREILEKYGLHNPVDASPDEELRNMILEGAMTSEQKEMYRRALSAYGKRKLPTCGLLEFAANNSPKVLRKHIWRLQRGLDEPMFGPPRKPLVRIERYVVERFAYLCPDCVYRLEESTERAGEERFGDGSLRWWQGKMGKPPFYDHSKYGFYLFRWGDEYATQLKHYGVEGFPFEEPYACERCGVTDVDLWRDQFGEEE